LSTCRVLYLLESDKSEFSLWLIPSDPFHTDHEAGFRAPQPYPLDPKDQPIPLATIHSRTGYLLTGDASHFGHLYRKAYQGRPDIETRRPVFRAPAPPLKRPVLPHSFGMVL
jgi:hypothetical protein